MDYKYEIAFDKSAHRWTVLRDENWLCDCIDKQTAKEIKHSLEIIYPCEQFSGAGEQR